MRRFFLLTCLLILSRSAYAAPCHVWWPQWKIASSEELSAGRKYSSYPIPLMLDGDAKTAWVYSAKSSGCDRSTFSTRYGFVLKPSTPITIDALRVMNGQNLNRARFQSNHRLTKIRVTLSHPRANSNPPSVRVINARLGDAMGWHTIRFPRQTVTSIKIEFPEIKKSAARNADVCIPELELRNQGQKIPWKLPRAVMFHDGTEGCTATLLITRHGKTLEGIALDVGYSDEWSHDGRYVAGFNGGGGNSRREHLWIADTWRGKVIREFKTGGQDTEYRWQDKQMLSVNSIQDNKKFTRIFKAPTFQ